MPPLFVASRLEKKKEKKVKKKNGEKSLSKDNTVKQAGEKRCRPEH